MKYRIAFGKTTLGLESSIFILLKSGFTPIGGICYDGKNYMQAMVKSE